VDVFVIPVKRVPTIGTPEEPLAPTVNAIKRAVVIAVHVAETKRIVAISARCEAILETGFAIRPAIRTRQ
jgi:hypothetical protein